MAGLNFGNRYMVGGNSAKAKQQYLARSNASKNKKKNVIQYDSSGKEIARFKGIEDASEKLKISYRRTKYILTVNKKLSLDELQERDGIYLKFEEVFLF